MEDTLFDQLEAPVPIIERSVIEINILKLWYKRLDTSEYPSLMHSNSLYYNNFMELELNCHLMQSSCEKSEHKGLHTVTTRCHTRAGLEKQVEWV